LSVLSLSFKAEREPNYNSVCLMEQLCP